MPAITFAESTWFNTALSREISLLPQEEEAGLPESGQAGHFISRIEAATSTLWACPSRDSSKP
jgi:hypothetical protein